MPRYQKSVLPTTVINGSFNISNYSI